MSIIKEWSDISANLKQSGKTLQDIENARKQFIISIPQKAKAAGLNDEQIKSAISAFDTFTKDQLTEEERYGVDNPIKGGIKQAGKEIYTALAQGAGRMVGGAARLYNDIGDNEKGTFADNLANAMEEDYQARDEAAGLGYQQAEGVRGFGKMLVQNIPQLAATYLPVAALKGTAALRGAKAGAAAIAAGKTVEAANAAKAAAIASTITKGSTTAKAASLALNYTGEYGDVSHTVAQKIKNTTVDELRNSEEYGAEFNALERQYYQQGMSADEASQKAKEYLLDNIRERRADVGAAVNTALEWIAPNAVSAINKMGGKKVGKAGDELTERAVADAIGNKRFSWGSKKEFANLGKQSLQEALQEGNTEFLGEQARANIDNGGVDWGNVAHSAALGALGGGIMGHGVHTLTTGGLQAERAKVLQQLDSISKGYQSATQAVVDNKVKLEVLNANQGNLTAADIAAKQQLEQDIALNQQVANEYEKQLKEAGALSTSDMSPNNPVVDTPVVDANVDTTQADDELKAMAERGDIPDFKMMTLQYGISPENLANMYGRHKKMAQLKTNVAEHIKQGDTQAAQEAMSQAGVKQEEADTILNEVIKVNTQPKEKTPLRSLSGLLAKNPNADFAKDVLPFLKKKHKINSTSEALALWNEARKATKSAMPIEQPLANAPQAEKAPISIPQSQTVVEPVSNNEATKVTTPSVVPMEVKATPEPVAEITPVVNNNVPIKDNAEPLVEHTTTKGKTIKGVVRKGITKEEAKLVDPYAFAKDGGFFIREKYLNPQEKNTNTATIKEDIKQKAESVAKEILAEVNLPKEQPTKTQQSNDDVIKDINGEYQHDQFPDVVATVSKTEKGYDINWGDEVQSFTGKNAAIKTKAALIKEKFNKKKSKQDGDGGATVEPIAPNNPLPPTNDNVAPKVTSKTDAEQIAEAMDKTAQAITEAAHNKVVERVKNGEEIVYKQPAAIERVKQDERYQVEINDKGHAVVKNVKDAQGNWVKPDMSNQSTQAEQRVEKKTEIKDEPKAYGKNVVSVYLTQGGQDGLVISKNEDKYHYTGKFGAGSGHSHADMLKIVNGIKSSKRGVKLGYGVEFELIDQSEQKAEQPKQDKPIKKTPIQGKDIWMEVEFIAGNKSKELFYHDRMTDPNKPFNTEAEAIADWESKTEEQSKEQSNSTIEETKQPTKKESLLIKIDDELDAALDDFAAIFKEQGKRLSSGVDPVIMGKVLAIGMKASTLYLAKGAVKFAVWAENIIAALSSKGVPQDAVQPYLKGLYAASKMQVSPEIRQQMDKEDDVYDFDFAILNESTSQDTQNVTTPSQTNGTNARERDKTPESSQVQGASKSEPAQANTEKRDDGVSANGGGRRDGGNLSDESRKSKTRSQKSDVASTRNQSPKLGDSTRSTEPSDGANLRNYRIQPNELKRTGSWKATAEQNVQIVELVKTIIAENRTATLEEKALLTKFTGWGASEIANGIFPNQYGQYKDANWKALGERLEAALTPEEYAQAKRTTQYAHYTSEPIIRSVYAALSRFGFNGGSMVEPGMGVGLFNGLMPDAMANNSQYTGIEYDTITGNIAKLLYPDSNVIVGDFTQTKLPKNFFDVAVGNPPFGNIKIQSDPEYKKQGFLLHDYFFAKTIDRVKEGGLLVFVTSKGTMDKANDRARKYLSERADLVGAIRLPQTAFKDNAGTEVVTDVIFLRKRTAEQEPAGEAWGNLQEITTPQGKTSINEYFANHPEMILGKSALTSSQYKSNEYTVEPIAGSDIEALFGEAINNLPENIYKPQQGSKAEQAAVQRRDYDPKIKKEGGIYVADDGVLMQVSNGQGTPLNQKQNSKHELVDLKPKEKEWLKDYVGVRDALKQAQYDQLQDNANWQKSLDALNKIYDAFVKKHGFMLDHTTSERENEDGSVTITKRFKNKSIMGLDAESALINALEQINGDNSISKAPALLGRVINKPSTPVITSTQDAMFVMFNELGRFDLAKVAKLINKSEKDVIAELGNSIYEDPSQSWTTADDYLSGNVVRKLKEAEQAARLNPKYQRNVTALKTVQPPALAPQDINVQLGAAWIPASDVVQFASEVLSERFRVNYSPLTGQWSVEGNANYSSEWGIPAKDSKDILEAVLNNRQIKVTFLDENKKTHTDTEKTEKANDIAKKMRQSFKKWLWEDVPRTERLATYYNEHFNNIAPRNFDGQHLTLPGVSSRFDLRPHQKRAIWRTIQQGDVYYAHAVGAGKTFTMIATGMEERRLGLVKKPMYVVPNHMLAQFSKEFLELYPMANIMVADETNFHTHNRRKFVAQAALNNPDAIVITHSAFGRIGMSSEYSSKFIKNQITDWQVALQEVGNDERITRKQIERRIEQLENKLKALLDGEKDQLLNFEELGVDRLYVDEGHEFRKLDFPTNRGNIKGIDPSGSQKSMDLYMKVEYLRSKNPNRSLVMASGTPVTNTMGELFTVQRFFNPSQLEEDGDGSFDAWSAHYGEVVDGLEQNAAGGYETVSRFAKFVNVPELMSRVRYFMDILTSNQLGDLVQRPDVVGGGRQVIVTPAPDGYKDYQKDLEKRIKDIRNRKAPPKPGDDIILSVIADGRFSAIDMRFVDSTLPSDPNSKLNRMLDDLISAYHETANNEYMTSGVIDENKGSSLMLFTDIGLGEQSAKNRGFDMKAWIEKRLVEGGVKREHIAFMRDNKAHSKKEKLFDDMRQGKKRILIGGKDMETGVNAQKRLTHLFHLDAPWFPASVEQREGRIIRQGNQNKIVAIRAYASKGSYDSTMWGMNSRKARFIEQAMSGDSSVRNMEDVSEASAFEMAAALASGDERYLKLAGLKGDTERLSRLYAAHIDEQKRFSREKNHLESSNKRSIGQIEQIKTAIAQRKKIEAGAFLANVGKQSFDNREDFSKALFDKFKEVAESYKADEIELGSIAGFSIVYNGVELRGGNFAADLRVDLPIDVEPLAIFPIDPVYSVSGIATRAVNQTNALDRVLAEKEKSIEQNTKDLARIGRRIGASFPEMAELNEKQQALNELEQELNAESKINDNLEQSDNLLDSNAFKRKTGIQAILAVGKNPSPQKGLSVLQAQKVADAFLKEYNGNIPLEIIVRDKQEDFYGEQASRENLGYTINGAYHPTKNRVSLVASTFLQPFEVRQTLRHEVLGHYGLNTLAPSEKLDLLKKIINSKKALSDKWAKIDELYNDKTELEKAEEVFAFTAENEPYSTLGEAWNSILALLNKALRKIGLIKDDLTYPELHKFAQSIAKGIRNGTRQQQTFPKSDNAQFRIELPTSSPERNLPQRSIRSAKNMAKFVGEFMTNIWTYKIGTKLDLALKNTRYKRVFDLVQAHLNHVSVEAYEAIELAPDLLGKLDTFEDYRKRLKTLNLFTDNFKQRNKNIEAAARVIFDGTLIDKQEFNEAQLRIKGLTDDQITFYKQARSAINISLKSSAKAEMTRVLLLANVIGEQVARVVTDRELNMDEHKQELLQIIDTKYQTLKVKRDAATDKDAKAVIKQQMKDLVDVIKMLHSVTKKANKLIQEGYAPLMRYGDYTSSVYDAKGELVDFRMFESASARDEFVESLSALNLKMKRFDADNANYDDAQAKSHTGFKVITGTMNNSLFEQFKGITPETLALFADVSNLKQTEEYQQYLKLAVSNNSAFKRLIHRKGIVGYSEDLQRVVASFVMSNARRSAKNIYNKLENDAVNAIPKEQGHLQEDAQKLVNYINNPVEEAQQFRNILFLWNLGLSFMFGLVNLTQPFMVTIPKLTEYTTASNAALKVSAATRLAYSATQKGQAPKGFEIEYAQAQREGHLDPQNAFVLAGIERGSTGLGSSYWQSLSHGFGLIAQVTESMNRKTVFIASMQIGQELQKNGKLKAQGFDSPYDFAIRIIQETQGIYNKGNRGNFARGPFGTVLMMFKQYPIMMVQLMGRMAINPQYAGEKDKYRKALLLLLAMLWGAAGATGLPFARDILDVIETAFAWSGKPVNIEREIQIGLGKEAADWVMNGVNAISPVDVKGRMGMGDLLPATSLLNPVAMGSVGGAQNKEVMQVLGAGGGLVQKFIDGASALGRGDYRNAAANLAPRSIESMVKGIEMGVTGVYTDRKGNKVRDVSVWDALAKFFDMNPAINARDSRTRGLEARDVMIQGSMARKFKAAALDALANNDMAAMDKVDAEVEKWNKDNPHYPVEIKARALYRKLRNANKTWQGRDEPPKGMEWMEQYR